MPRFGGNSCCLGFLNLPRCLLMLGFQLRILLLELPALLEALPGSQLSEAADGRPTIAELHRLRATAGSGSAPTLPDPLGEPEQVLAEAARVIDAVTGALAAALLPGRSPRHIWRWFQVRWRGVDHTSSDVAMPDPAA